LQIDIRKRGDSEANHVLRDGRTPWRGETFKGVSPMESEPKPRVKFSRRSASASALGRRARGRRGFLPQS